MGTAPRVLCATLVLLWGGFAGSLSLRAEGAERLKPEALLSEQSVVYLRFDGLKAHQTELDKTVLAQLLAEDLHPLMDYLKKLALNATGPDVVAERLLAGAEPDKLIEIQKSARLMPRLIENVSQRGLLVGAETTMAPLPGAQATIVFPGAAEPEYRDGLFAAVRLIAILSDREVEETEQNGRTMLKISKGPATLACWQEGDHVVSTFGTAPPDGVVARAKGKGENLTAHPLFKQLGQFHDYDTYARGFIDTKRGVDFARGIFPPAAGTLDEIGLSGVTSVSLHMGCEDELLRNTVVLATTEERKGLLAGFSAADDLKIEELPPLPPDTSMMAAASLDAGAVYESITGMIGVLVRSANPGRYEDYQRELEKFEEKLGGDVRRDLNDAVQSSVVAYSCPSEGAFFFGSGLAFKVKDEEKLHAVVERLFRTLAEYGGAEVTFRKQPYRDGELSVVEFDAATFPFSPTYTVHGGWFVIGLSPQAAQGLIVRSSDEFRTWQPSPIMKRALAGVEARRASQDSPAKVLAVTHIDPRPTVATVLSYSSFFIAIARSRPFRRSGFEFDATLIPNTQAITERLSPGSAVVLDDGKSIRIDTHDTLPLPLDVSGFGGAYTTPLLIGAGF
jgi:hypothetical protein